MNTISLRRRQVMIAGLAAAAAPAPLFAQVCVPVAGAASRPPKVAELVAAIEGDKLIVSGRVMGSDCKPLAGALVEVWSASSERGTSVTTDADGRFMLTTAAATEGLQLRVSHRGQTIQTQRRLMTEGDTDGVTAHVERDESGVWRTTLGLVLA
jgi:hypothetical protein